jgi:hypothetical protein
MSCLETPSLRKPRLDTRRSGHKHRTGPPGPALKAQGTFPHTRAADALRPPSVEELQVPDAGQRRIAQRFVETASGSVTLVAACSSPLGLSWDYEPSTLTAANSGVIFAIGYGYACIFPDNTGFIVDGKYVITGGTGRFANASGSGIATSSVIKGVFSITWDGTISSVGSNP